MSPQSFMHVGDTPISHVWYKIVQRWEIFLCKIVNSWVMTVWLLQANFADRLANCVGKRKQSPDVVRWRISRLPGTYLQTAKRQAFKNYVGARYSQNSRRKSGRSGPFGQNHWVISKVIFHMIFITVLICLVSVIFVVVWWEPEVLQPITL